MTTFAQVADAIERRVQEWDRQAGPNELPLSYCGNELGGETGEAIEAALDLLILGRFAGRAENIIKKLEREELGLVGSRATVEELGNELADVVLCAFRVARRTKQRIDLGAALVRKFNLTSEKNGLQTRIEAGDELEAAKALVRQAGYQLFKNEYRGA